MIEFKERFCIILDYTYLINIGWIRTRIRMDQELLPGSGSGTWKIQSWIRIQIHNTGFNAVFWIRICTDPHKDMPPGSGSTWTDADPDPGGEKA